MISLTRRSILNVLVIVAFLAALPAAIHRLFERGDLYLFTRDFLADMLARLSGPGRLRFILQPAVAIALGYRDGLRDARSASAPFLWALLFHGQSRQLTRHAFASVRDLVAVAILLDMISQYLIFQEVHPGAALLLGSVLIAIPYSFSRALANRITRRRTDRVRAVDTT